MRCIHVSNIVCLLRYLPTYGYAIFGSLGRAGARAFSFSFGKKWTDKVGDYLIEYSNMLLYTTFTYYYKLNP